MESAATPLHQLTVHSAGDHAVAVRSGSTRCLGGADCGLYITQGCSWCSLFRRLALLGIEPERQREFPAASVGGRHGIEERVAHVVALEFAERGDRLASAAHHVLAQLGGVAT